jgi:hypothetical protein
MKLQVVCVFLHIANICMKSKTSYVGIKLDWMIRIIHAWKKFIALDTSHFQHIVHVLNVL